MGGGEKVWKLAKDRCTEGTNPACFAPLEKSCERNDGEIMPVPESGCSEEPVLGRFRPATCHQCLYDFCATKDINSVTAAKLSDDMNYATEAAINRADSSFVRMRNELQRALESKSVEKQVAEMAKDYNNTFDCGVAPTFKNLDPNDPGCDGCGPSASCTLRVAVTNGTKAFRRTCLCKAGFFGDGHKCTVCPVGTAKAYDGNSASCDACAPGFYQDEIGAEACRACPVDTFSNLTGAATCLRCSENATSSIGSASCACKDKYTGNGRACVAINNCAGDMAAHGCDQESRCVNTGPAENMCSCNEGYTGDGTSCIEINFCETDAHKCTHKCTPTGPGTYNCSCNAGYESHGSNCSEIDACKSADLNDCDNAATCTKTGPATFTCSCNQHYTGDGTVCGQINYCESENGGCSDDATCTPVLGTAKCSCNTFYSGDGKTCTEVNPCKEDNPCDTKAKCNYLGAGNHSCTCKSGYRGAGSKGQCVAINHCDDGTDGCSENSTTCKYTGPGQFTCKCKLNHEGKLGDKQCTPVNNCLKKNGGCGSHSKFQHKCVYTGPGTHRCDCGVGFEDTSVSAKPKSSSRKLLSLKPSIYASKGDRCQPIDPCKTENGGCSGDGAICTLSEPGKSVCGCKAGSFNKYDKLCATCPVGTYKLHDNRYMVQSRCSLCPLGKSTFGKDSSSFLQEDLLGPKASSEPKTPVMTPCKNCPAGKFGEWTKDGAAVCTPCPAGSTSKAGAKACHCKSGYHVSSSPSEALACTACPAGKVSQQLHSDSCVPCPAGTKSRGGLSGQEHCDLCPASTYSDKPSSSKCKACTAGRVSQAGATRCKCPPGHEYHEDEKKCMPCWQGFFSADGGKCTPAPKGTYVGKEGATKYTPCASGTYGPRKGAAECIPCVPPVSKDTAYAEPVFLQDGMQLEAFNDTSRAAQGGYSVSKKVGATTCRYSDDNTTNNYDNSGTEAEDSSDKKEDEVVWVKEAQNCNHTCATQKYGDTKRGVCVDDFVIVTVQGEPGRMCPCRKEQACSGHGILVSPGVCKCVSGWQGNDCRSPQNPKLRG